MKKLVVLLGIFFYVSFVVSVEVPIKIDFDHTNSYTNEGYVGFMAALYNSEVGYGWSSAVSSNDYWGDKSLYLTKDKHYSTEDRIFMMDLPNGDYTVDLIFYNEDERDSQVYDNIEVSAEGNLVFGDIDVLPYNYMDKSFDISVSDGQLNIGFSDNGGSGSRWMICALRIKEKITRPKINVVSADLIEKGNSVTISGLNFGSKSVAAPMKFDDFEDGVDGELISGNADPDYECEDCWTDYSAFKTSSTEDPKYSSINNRPGSTLNDRHHMVVNYSSDGKVFSDSYLIYNGYKDLRYKVFVSFWTYFDWGYVEDDTIQIKLFRIIGDMDDDSANVLLQGFKGGTFYNGARTTDNIFDALDSTSVPPEQNMIKEKGWTNIQVEVKATNPGELGVVNVRYLVPNESNHMLNFQGKVLGDLSYWEPNKQYNTGDRINGGRYVFEALNSGTSGSVEPTWPEADHFGYSPYINNDVIDNGITWRSDMFNVFRDIRFGHYYGDGSNPTDAETTLFFDDIYIDDSWARVEIGNNQEYEKCNHLETQVANSWSSNSISFNFNQGSFPNGEEVYLFVINENGTASEGYPITIGGSGAELDCVDEDGDGYGVGMNCLGSDCDDLNSSIHMEINCEYNGSSCGNFSFCSLTCLEIPEGACELGIYHEADLDEDGNISLNELVDYVELWLDGDVSIADVIEVIGIWKG